MRKKTIWITETALMTALLIVLQNVTKPMGQFVTGSCVNLTLALATLVGGYACGVSVALASPFLAFLLHIGPALFPVVPMVAVGNLVLVTVLHFLFGGSPLRRIAAVILAALLKSGALYLLVVKLVLPRLYLAGPQAAALTASFSWPQLVTAFIGGAAASLIVPPIRRALKR